LVIFPIAGQDSGVLNSQVANLLATQTSQSGGPQTIIVPPNLTVDNFDNPAAFEEFFKSLDLSPSGSEKLEVKST